MCGLLDSSVWQRVGRGRSQNFDLSAEAIQELLQTALPDVYQPYFLLIFSMVKKGPVYTPQCEQVGFEQFAEYAERGRWNFNLGSHVLTPALAREPIFELPQAILSTNGLINVQCGLKTKRGAEIPAFGLVDKVANVETYDVVEHTEYLAIYRKLCAAAKAKVIAMQQQ